mgnify:CR=1 FL=1
MSYDILQQPTSPNVEGTPLVYALSSSNAGQPQFRYVLKTPPYYDQGSYIPGVDIKAYPNKEGIGHFDLSVFANNQMEYYYNLTPLYTTYGLGLLSKLDLEYGEEYAPNFNTNPTYYQIGQLPELRLLQGYKNTNDDTGTGYNFDSGSYLISSGSNIGKVLSSDPSIFIIGEQPTVKKYVPRSDTNGALYGLLNVGSQFNFTVLGYDSSDSLISMDSIQWGIGSNVTITLAYVNTTPLFPNNFPNLAANWDSIKYYDFILGGTEQIVRQYVLEDCEIADKTTFSWINEFGVFDHYFVANPRRRTSNIKRHDYDRTFVRYEDNNSSYNITNRGKRQYLTEYDYTYSVTTDWLNKEEANWLSGLFESNSVYVENFEGSNYPPPYNVYKNPLGVNIIKTSYEVNNNTSRNKLFQYTIDFKFSTQYQDR